MIEISKGALAKVLSSLQKFANQKVSVEQYSTPSELAAEVLWQAQLQGDIDEKTVLDLGAGTGILGIGAALLGGKVTLIEQDEEALEIAKRNVTQAKVDVKIVKGLVEDYAEKADTIIMNPPFGTKQIHADRAFLDKAFSLAPVVWSMHKTSTHPFILSYAKEAGYSATFFPAVIQLPHSQSFHKKPVKPVEITVYRFIRP
ncbi:MAG: METTL5 family protein [Candidatus Woesearchaeota archaeon]|jgi:putative methylase|nr:METTL5 family protein [Candidatus Woesearchaeota archaeon]MDP7181984.1 METTL5 family protein [Candidatus Woesearchaeota archaeon]MDP7198964.1 METTL5 family protein [Candidatus Woesearchaeota archaeon]MDP7467344.1 METTL5 family protein [Candidatus Woesearchaeota archaeon]MDP7646602.1 METTL5 family protein [Candidatus Woesearchaeota archaeon]|tara:strand:+ start:101 stop:703 length:603 start_codon:yes stop_codon:yes gene_type:complete